MSWSSEIDAWAVATFGRGTLARAMQRTDEEYCELGEGLWGAKAHVAEECADVVICLTRVCSILGFDLAAEVEKKMVKNHARKWRVIGDGTGYHE